MGLKMNEGKIKVINEFYTDYYLNVPNGHKRYVIPAATAMGPGAAYVTKEDYEAILMSQGGREILIKRLIIDIQDKDSVTFVGDYGIEPTDFSLSKKELYNKYLNSINYQALEKFLIDNSDDPGILEKIALTAVENHIMDIKIIEILKKYTGYDGIQRVLLEN